MRVLMLSSDKDILRENSETRQRMIEYGKLVQELHIIVICKNELFSTRYDRGELKIKENVFVYQVSIFNAIKIGKKLPRPNLVTSQDAFEIGFIGWRLAKYFKTKLQLQIHTDFLSPYFRKESLKNRVRRWIAKFLIPRADCIRVVSKKIESSLLKIDNWKLKIVKLPIWVDAEKIKNAPIKTDLHKKYPQFDFIILMASRLTKEKNIGLAIDAIKEFPKVGLIIVGDGPMKKNYELRIKNYENIKLEPRTNDLASYYKTCDLFLLTSNYEGYGRTLVEAVIAGCKIISSDVGIADEILEKENIFKVGDKNGLTEKIEKAIKKEIKPARPLKIKTKEEYLGEYKKSWEMCL